jgi:hypothetical protein
MTFSDLTSLDRNDVLGWLGLEPRQSRGSWVLGSLGLFGAGLAVGASVALLVAPKSGRELREDLKDRLGPVRVPGMDASTAPTVRREDSRPPSPRGSVTRDEA